MAEDNQREHAEKLEGRQRPAREEKMIEKKGRGGNIAEKTNASTT